MGRFDWNSYSPLMVFWSIVTADRCVGWPAYVNTSPENDSVSESARASVQSPSVAATAATNIHRRPTAPSLPHRAAVANPPCGGSAYARTSFL